MTSIESKLRELSHEPFAVLQELEQLSKSALAGFAGVNSNAAEWVGVGCRLAQDRYLIHREEVREVMMMPPSITRVPGARPWVAGLANLRGLLLPVIDLRIYLGAGTSKGAPGGRVLVANNSELPFGIIVDEVFGFRRFPESAHTPENPDTVIHCDRYLDGACEHGDDLWPIFSLTKLAAADEFQQAAA
jgi:twitching motility protein PilI